MRKTWAIARNLISESLRMKVAVGFLVLLTGILVCLPLLMKGDGTLTGRVQTFLSYSLWSLAFILGILTLFVSCGSLAGEVENKHAFLTATKPVTRGQMMIGKWLGVAVLDLVLLGIGGGMIFATVQYMRRLPGTHALDRFTLESEVLTCRHAVSLKPPKEEFDAAVQGYVERLREERRPMSPEAEAEVREQKRAELWRDFRTVEPLQVKSWLFEDLRIARDPQRVVHLRYKLQLSRAPVLHPMRFYWVFGDRGKGATQYVRAVEDPEDQVRSAPIPCDAIGTDGSLLVSLVNRDPDEPPQPWLSRISFEQPDDLQVLYLIGTFGGNYLRALALVYCRLLFLAALGLFAASFLGFPVACMVAFTIYFAASLAGYIGESLEFISPVQRIDDPFEYVAFTLRPLVAAFLWMLPRFGAYDPIGTLIDGRLVTLRWVLTAVVQLVLIRTTVIGLAAILIFGRRELAEVVV